MTAMPNEAQHAHLYQCMHNCTLFIFIYKSTSFEVYAVQQ